MHLRYVFSELRIGLRRNISMHLAVVLTLVVSLTLVGLGVVIRQQSDKAAAQWGSELEITAYLCKDRDDNPACATEVTDAQKEAIEKVIKDSPDVASFRFESKETAFEKVQQLYDKDFDRPDSPISADDMPESYWISLKDPDQYAGIESAIVGLDGVSRLSDQRETVAPLLRTMKVMRWVSFGAAIVLVVVALLLVANTIRLAALARRREISIMRLVGASGLYITLPFLMEALVTAAIALALTVGTLVGLMYFGVEQWLKEELGFIPWVDWSDLMTAIVVVAVLAPVLTVLPTLVVSRKSLKV